MSLCNKNLPVGLHPIGCLSEFDSSKQIVNLPDLHDSWAYGWDGDNMQYGKTTSNKIKRVVTLD